MAPQAGSADFDGLCQSVRISTNRNAWISATAPMQTESPKTARLPRLSSTPRSPGSLVAREWKCS